MSINTGPLSVSACLLVFMTVLGDAKLCPHGTTSSNPLRTLDTNREIRGSIEHCTNNKTNRECTDAQAAADVVHPRLRRGSSSDSDESVASSSIKPHQDGPSSDDDFNLQEDTENAHSTRAFLCPRRGSKKMIGFGLAVPLLVAGTYFLSAGNGIFPTEIPGGNGEVHNNHLEGENMNVLASANVDALQKKNDRLVCIKCNVQQNVVKKGGSVGTIKQSGGGRRGGGGRKAAEALGGAAAGAVSGAAIGALGGVAIGPVGAALGGVAGSVAGGVAVAERT